MGRYFEPTTKWVKEDGTPSDRALGWMRSLADFVGFRDNAIPGTSLGGDGATTKFLRADGTYAVPGYPVGADPTGTVGTAAVNGSAATFMRSDAAPTLDLGIFPTWTGVHTFSLAPTFTLGATFTGAIDGNGAFGCNGATPQTAATVNAAVAGTAGGSYTGTEQTMLNDLKALVNQLRSTLIANGIAV